MDTTAALRSARFVFELALANTRRPEQFLLERANLEIDPSLADPQEWDNYWNEKADTAGSVFEFIAGIYRRAFIKPALEKAVRSAFPPGAEVLHAGCGSGQVDKDLQSHLRITAVDISPAALHLYARNNPGAASFKHASIFALPCADASFDGIYNLGVMEHFVPSEIHSIFREFSRVIKPGGHLLLFWPMSCAPSVKVLGLAHFVLNKLLKRRATLHPAEVSLLHSKDDAARFLSEAGFTLESFHFGYGDLFTQAQIIASKPGAVSSTR